MVNKYGDNYVVSFVVAKYVSDGDDVDYFLQCSVTVGWATGRASSPF